MKRKEGFERTLAPAMKENSGALLHWSLTFGMNLFFFMLLIYFEQYQNEITICSFICRKIKEKKKLDTKEFLRNQQETKISEGYNLINGAKL